MYSNLYNYFEIRSDEKRACKKPIKEVDEILEQSGVLKKNDNSAFVNKDNFPWINITCSDSTIRNHLTAKTFSNECDLLTIVTSKREVAMQEKYTVLLNAIASKLGWELILEEDEDGNENIVVYKS